MTCSFCHQHIHCGGVRVLTRDRSVAVYCHACNHADIVRSCAICDTLADVDALRRCDCDAVDICVLCTPADCDSCREGRELEEAERTAYNAWRNS